MTSEIPKVISDADLSVIGAILRDLRELDISVRKSECIKRRIAMRVRVTGCTSIHTYAELLASDPQELDLLLRLLHIHVSQFFRNPAMFQALAEQVFPRFFARSAHHGLPLRICSIGCACGEEPYSLAILLKEHFSSELLRQKVSITALDIDQLTLQSARNGVYTEERLKSLPLQLKDRYFRPETSGFRLIEPIRKMVTFRHGDMTMPGTIPDADLVLCRNTLIYFNRPAQERILRSIADKLARDGILVMGKSETLGSEMRRRFEPLCHVERIYRKIC